MADFVHLHLHSAYSLSEGAIPVSKLKDLCLEAGMPAVAVTDTNNLFGALEVSEVMSAARRSADRRFCSRALTFPISSSLRRKGQGRRLLFFWRRMRRGMRT